MSDKDKENGTDSPDLSEHICEGLAEVLDSAEIEIAPEQRIVLAEEIVEKFISPLMIQQAAGATSQVSVTMNPVGGVSGAHSTKGRNAIVNVRQVLTTAPASLPALAKLYQEHGIAGDVTSSALAVLYLFPLLKAIAEIRKGAAHTTSSRDSYGDVGFKS